MTGYPGIDRKEMLDAAGCDRWKKGHYVQFNNGHNCGICSSVCAYGLKSWNKPQKAPDRHNEKMAPALFVQSKRGG